MAAPFVLCVLAVAAVLFCLERIPVDAVALGVLVALLTSGILTPSEALSGFASEAVIVIAGLFVLTAGLKNSGFLEWLGQRVQGIGSRRPRLAAALLLALVVACSAFMNNTATTAVFLPLALSLSRSMGTAPSRLLMPLAFASILGGSITLIGTSTNVITSGLLPGYGLAPLSFFELAPVALPLALLGLLYLLIAPHWLLAAHPVEDLAEEYGLRDYLTELIIGPRSPLIGQTLTGARLARRWGINVLGRVGEGGEIAVPALDEPLAAGDLLLAEGRLDTLETLIAEADVGIHRGPGEVGGAGRRPSLAAHLLEVLVLPRSDLVGRSLEEVGFRQRFRANAVALNRHGESLIDKVGRIPLAVGDVLLLYGEEAAERLLAQQGLLLLSRRRPRRAGRAIVLTPAIFALVIALNVSGVTSLAGSVLLGCLLLLITRCLTPQEAYVAIEWRLLVLVAGMMAAGTAMIKTGAVTALATALVGSAGGLSHLALLAIFYGLTVALTQPMSNQAAALVVLPVALGVAGDAGLSLRAMAVTVTLAASSSFLTPLEPSCLLVYGPGRYRFLDYPKLGLALTLLALLLTLLLVPRFWPPG